MNIAELHALSPGEKLRVIEALWNDLVSEESQVPSPVWHEAKLRETEEAYRAGREEALDWSTAKESLREQFR